MNVLIIRDDAVPDTLEGLLDTDDRSSSSTTVLLSEFITSHGYRYDDPSGRFMTDKPSRESEHPAQSLLLVNRVVDISNDSCAKLADGTSIPTRGQVSHVYETLLKGYVQPYISTYSYSTVGKLVPLFTQWSMVKETLPWISVPEFRYGYGPEIVDAQGFENPIYTSPFNLYNWRPNSPLGGIPMDTFIVERPKGDPLLAFFCGRHVAMRWLSDGSPVGADLATNLREALLSVKDTFSAFTGESLWFVDGEKKSFASFSHRLVAAQRFPEIKTLLNAAIADACDSLPSRGNGLAPSEQHK